MYNENSSEAPYWGIAEDNTIKEFAKKTKEGIFESFKQLVDKYTETTFQRKPDKDEKKKVRHPAYMKSNKRIDFEINLYEQIIEHANSKLTELENVRETRL